MAVGERDQLFRMPIGGAPQQMSDFGADVAGFKLAPTGDRVIVWADQKDCPTGTTCNGVTGSSAKSCRPDT